MSKLFDQLKDAAREREGGLLMGALAKKQSEEAAAAAAASVQAEPRAPLPAPAPAPVRDGSAPVATAPASVLRTPLGGIALAAAIFGIAVLAWHSAPWRAPQKVKIDPEELKLDRKLDLERPSPREAASAPRPS